MGRGWNSLLLCFSCLFLLHFHCFSINLADSGKAFLKQNVEHTVYSFHRKLLMNSNNLPAVLVATIPPQEIVVPAIGSGSFPAIGFTVNELSAMKSEVTAGLPVSHSQETNANNESGLKWVLFVIIPAAALLMIAAVFLIMQPNLGSAKIGPWIAASGKRKPGTGVNKFSRLELEAACENFSNILHSFPDCTLFKGTLPSGVEIGVVSTVISSVTNWSMHSEMHFRKKIDMLSKVNHKNFVSLLGYCEENKPFMRSVVLESVSNGNLYEYLHDEDFDHLDWSARMRIIMGIAYCLQHLQHEVNPPVSIPNLQSNYIFLTEDFSVKVADLSIWKEEIAGKHHHLGHNNTDHTQSPLDHRSTVYSFGIVMLEIISGKPPHSEEHGSLLKWASEYLSDENNMKHLVDPKLKDHKTEQLKTICEVIQECVHPNPGQKVELRDITSKLREALGVSPEQAGQRLSPLWWALEILSSKSI